MLLLLLNGLLRHGLGQRIDSSRGTAAILIVVVREHDVQSVVDDSGQFCVLDEGHLVDVLGLIAAHQEVLVQVAQIRHQLILYEFGIQVFVVVLQENVVLLGCAW